MRRTKKQLEQNLKQIFARQEDELADEGLEKPSAPPLDFLTQEMEESPAGTPAEQSKKPDVVQPPALDVTSVEKGAVSVENKTGAAENEKLDEEILSQPAASAIEKSQQPPESPLSLAVEDEDKGGQEDALRKILVFRLGDGYFGVSVFRVQTIIRPQPVYPVPGTEKFITGLINLRGEVVPTIDLHIRLGLPPQEQDDQTRFVVTEYGEYLASLIVDEVMGVENIPESVFQKPADVVMDVNTEYLAEIARHNDRLVLVLDLAELIARQEVRE